jgi:hypothetical protein
VVVMSRRRAVHLAAAAFGAIAVGYLSTWLVLVATNSFSSDRAADLTLIDVVQWALVAGVVVLGAHVIDQRRGRRAATFTGSNSGIAGSADA